MLSLSKYSTFTQPTFGSAIESRAFASGGYRFGFNGMEKDSENNSAAYDFGARVLDVRLGRWLAVDPLANKYPSISLFAFTINTPIQAYDPDGRLVLFAHGFLLSDGLGNKKSSSQGELIYKSDYNEYWGEIDKMFMQRTGDYNVRYFNGEHSATSQASDRMAEGKTAAQNLHAQILSGEVQLKKNDAGEIIETIQIVGHSQGAAYAAGMAEELVKLGYKVENVYYLAPHQPADIINPEGVRGVQFSHPLDRVSSNAPWWLMNGGSELGQIQGVNDENYQVFQDPAWNMRMKGDRGGHNVGLHSYIFDNACSGSGGNVSPSSSPGSIVGELNPGAQKIKLNGGGSSYTWE